MNKSSSFTSRFIIKRPVTLIYLLSFIALLLGAINSYIYSWNALQGHISIFMFSWLGIIFWCVSQFTCIPEAKWEKHERWNSCFSPLFFFSVLFFIFLMPFAFISFSVWCSKWVHRFNLFIRFFFFSLQRHCYKPTYLNI